MTYDEYLKITDKVLKIEKSIAPCGLVCELCGERSHCKGCNFSRDDEHGCSCFQRKCSRSKGIKGCWECDNFSCGKDMHNTDEHGVRLVAFVRYARDNGLHRLADRIVRNEENGIIYHRDHVNHKGDYDNCISVNEVIELLEKGKKYIYAKKSNCN